MGKGDEAPLVLVVNPNPALDRVAVVHFKREATLRPERLLIWPGGSGVHAGHVARQLGCRVLVQCFVAGHTGALFADKVAEHGLEAEMVEVAGETRQTFSLIDLHEGNICDVAERGPAVGPEDVLKLEVLALRRIPEATVLVISGSLPDGCDPDLPARLIVAARKAGVPALVDLAGDLLLRCLPARPWAIKPSRTELADLLGREEITSAEVVEAAQRFLEAGAENVLVSLDADGLLLVNRDRVARYVPPHVLAYNSIGCGDTLVGAVAAAFAQHPNLHDALRVGVAAAAANLQYDAPGHCTHEDVNRLVGQVRVSDGYE